MRELARLHGVQPAHTSALTGRRVQAGEDTVRAVLAGLGVDTSTARACRAALHARRRELATRVLEPVLVLWEGGTPELGLRLPAGAAERLRARLCLEDGRTLAVDTRPSRIRGSQSACCRGTMTRSTRMRVSCAGSRSSATPATIMPSSRAIVPRYGRMSPRDRRKSPCFPLHRGQAAPRPGSGSAQRAQIQSLGRRRPSSWRGRPSISRSIWTRARPKASRYPLL